MAADCRVRRKEQARAVTMTPFPPLWWLGAFAGSVLVSVDSFLLLLRLPLAFAAQLALEKGDG